MKKYIIIFGLVILVLFQFKQLFAETYFKAVFMSPEKALKKWGRQPFEPGDFKSFEAKKKAAMAVDIILTKKFIGKSILEDVRGQLGRPDGYFFSDTIIAYEIDPLAEGKKESWEMVFMPDKSLKFVKEVRIHKKCCYPEPPWVK
jgi:hypothetical protein